jgi:ribA/ribD-fused uncharacterized protein
MLARNDIVFFWGSKSPFSQWHPSPFVAGGVEFKNAEQYMMYGKAKMFGSDAIAEEVMATTSSKEMKALGRQVAGFDQQTWNDRKLKLVMLGNLYKFRQNPELGHILLGTDGKVLVEASPYDKIWGIGLRDNHPDACDPSKWPGQNLLGKALMQVRHKLLAEALENEEKN